MVGFSKRDPLVGLRVFAGGYSKISGRANPEAIRTEVTGRMGASLFGLAVEWI